MSKTADTIKKLNTTQEKQIRHIAGEIIEARKRFTGEVLNNFILERRSMVRGYIRGVIDSDNNLSIDDFKTIWIWFTVIAENN